MKHIINFENKFNKYLEDKSEIDYWIDILNLFLKNVDSKIVSEYLNNNDNFILLQDHIGDQLKPEFGWISSVGLIEALEQIIEESKSNGNIKY
jgi:hypothetical protein